MCLQMLKCINWIELRNCYQTTAWTLCRVLRRPLQLLAGLRQVGLLVLMVSKLKFCVLWTPSTFGRCMSFSFVCGQVLMLCRQNGRKPF